MQYLQLNIGGLMIAGNISTHIYHEVCCTAMRCRDHALHPLRSGMVRAAGIVPCREQRFCK
jgi:hypothetical protein